LFYLFLILSNTKVNIPNIDNGITMEKFEEVIKNYVKVRTLEYYRWKDYQYSIQYAGNYSFNCYHSLTYDSIKKHAIILTQRLKLLYKPS
jgi:hypothetical protein